MTLELRQQLKLTQQLIMTPQLQMAIKLLQLSRLELMETIRTELEENPALEEVPESTSPEQLVEQTDTPPEEAPAEKEVTIEEKLQQDIDWSNYLDEYNTPGRVQFEAEDRDTPRFESFIARTRVGLSQSDEEMTHRVPAQFTIRFFPAARGQGVPGGKTDIFSEAVQHPVRVQEFEIRARPAHCIRERAVEQRNP